MGVLLHILLRLVEQEGLNDIYLRLTHKLVSICFPQDSSLQAELHNKSSLPVLSSPPCRSRQLCQPMPWLSLHETLALPTSLTRMVWTGVCMPDRVVLLEPEYYTSENCIHSHKSDIWCVFLMLPSLKHCSIERAPHWASSVTPDLLYRKMEQCWYMHTKWLQAHARISFPCTSLEIMTILKWDSLPTL